MPPQIIYTLEDSKEILECGPFKTERDNLSVKEAKFKEVKKDDNVEN